MQTLNFESRVQQMTCSPWSGWTPIKMALASPMKLFKMIQQVQNSFNSHSLHLQQNWYSWNCQLLFNVFYSQNVKWLSKVKLCSISSIPLNVIMHHNSIVYVHLVHSNKITNNLGFGLTDVPSVFHIRPFCIFSGLLNMSTLRKWFHCIQQMLATVTAECVITFRRITTNKPDTHYMSTKSIDIFFTHSCANYSLLPYYHIGYTAIRHATWNQCGRCMSLSWHIRVT